jgi:signal transduction histidine kinase
MGIALIYVLESRVFLSTLSSELLGEAVLVQQMIEDRDKIWQDTTQAQAFVAGLDPRLEPRVMLLDAQGHLLASSKPVDASLLGQLLDHLDLDRILAGQVLEQRSFSRQLQQEIVEVVVPVEGPDGQVAGIIHLSHPFSNIYDDFLRLRYVIGGVLLAGGLLGAVVGLSLALNMERPLRQLTQAVSHLARGEQLTPLPERGPQELRSLLAAVNVLVERLRSLEQARRQLLANLVHELGRPLGAVRSAIDALEEGADQDATLRQELLEGMGKEIDRLGRLVDDLAGLHDQVLGTMELQLRPTGLTEWLNQSLGPWREAAQARGIHWQAIVPADLPDVQIDVDRLGQALGNLLSNAIKYTPAGGAISVSAGVLDQEVWITVSDSGPGIAPEERERIFTPFYRSQSGRRFPQGLGLGLSIARDIAAAHGGRLELESTLKKGSHFTLRLPLGA